MVRRRGWLAVLGTLGVSALILSVVVRGFLEPTRGHELAWIILGVLPIFVFGCWLLTASASRMALLVASAGTAMLLSAAYESLLVIAPALLASPVFPFLNAAGLTADGLATAAMLSVFATFPFGTVEHRWQRVVVWIIWSSALVAPLALITSPVVITSPYLDFVPAVPNPFAVPWLAWAGPGVEALLVQPLLPIVAGTVVLGARALFGPPEVRARTRVMALAIAAALLAFAAWVVFPDHWLAQAAVFPCLIAIPLAAIHGILRAGAFDIAPGDRGRLAARSTAVMATVFYGIAVAAPGLLLPRWTSAVTTALLSAVLAIGLLPVRSGLIRWVHRALLGDRERHLAVITAIGARLEHATDRTALLGELASALRDGLNATWVRIRLTEPDGDDDPAVAEAGERTGPVVESCDLVHDGEALGAVEVGARRRGEYSDAEQELLRTVAAQASVAAANLRLSSRLSQQLTELEASRSRLLAAQDDERRRLERDLHDGIQQNIVAQIAALRLARNRFERGELRADELAELQDQARETLSDLRELARGIHPPVLSDNGLVAAVESGAARFPIPLTVDADASLRSQRFAEEVETTAYYVVREALANTAKHAHATRAVVELSRRDGSLRIAVRDDGRGMAARELQGPASRGGLANIRDRVAALRGTVQVAPGRPTGTTVVVELPVDGGRPTGAGGRRG